MNNNDNNNNSYDNGNEHNLAPLLLLHLKHNMHVQKMELDIRK